MAEEEKKKIFDTSEKMISTYVYPLMVKYE
jgi:hypothetical protein